MNPKLLSIVLLTTTSSSLFAQMDIQVHSNNWRKVTCYQRSEDYKSGVSGSTTIFGTINSKGWANAFADGDTAKGDGYAYDAAIGVEILKTAPAVGTHYCSYRYRGQAGSSSTTGGGSSGSSSSEGEVEMFGTVEVSGEADLINADCAAAALGYAQFETNIDANAYAVLETSAGETVSNKLGNLSISYKGFGGSVNIDPGQGTGTYNDSDNDADGDVTCTSFFEVTHKTRAYIKVWANATFGSAKCTADMSGSVSTTSHLLDCPH